MFNLFVHLFLPFVYSFYSAESSVQLSSQLRKKSSTSLSGRKKRSSNFTPLVLFFIDFKVTAYTVAMDYLQCLCHHLLTPFAVFADAMNQVDEESEALQEKFLEKEIDTAAFVQKYKKLRTLYHRRALTHLAAKSSIG